MNQSEKTPIGLSNTLIGALADAFGKGPLTIRRWVIRKDIILTTDIARAIFIKYGIDWNNGDVKELEVCAEV